MHSHTFYPEHGEPLGFDAARSSSAPRIHAAPSPPSTEPPVERREPRHRARALAAGAGLAILGGVFYVSLFVIVGQEILAAALVIGLLAGAGMRLGGAQDRWPVAFAASALGTLVWGIAAAAGDALLMAIDPAADIPDALASQLAQTAGVFSSPSGDSVIAVIAVGLVMAGAVVSTALFTRRRPRRSALP